MTKNAGVSRRGFLAALAGVGSALAMQNAQAQETANGSDLDKPMALGFDNFSIRDLGWKAPKLLEHAASLKCDTVLFSDLGVYENTDEAYLQEIKAKADSLGIRIQQGTGSICPTSQSYNEERWGPAQDHLLETMRIAKTVGSDVVRCFIGSHRDRQGDGGIFRHIESTANLLKQNKSRILDSGMKIAIENHAGDTQAWELVELFKMVGPDAVGATIDSGNATWTMEDPMINLKILGPYTVSSGIRDSMIWEDQDGAQVQWANMGDGLVDWKAYFKLYSELCPNAPVQLEIISGKWGRSVPYFKEEHWEVFPDVRAHEFAMFVKMASRGEPYQDPLGRPKDDEPAQQLWDLKQSISYCRDVLGLGLKKA